MFLCPAVQIIKSLHNQRNIIICADMAASNTMLLHVFYTFLCCTFFLSAICSTVVPLRGLLTVLWPILEDWPSRKKIIWHTSISVITSRAKLLAVNTEYQLWSPHALNTDLSPELLQVLNILWIWLFVWIFTIILILECKICQRFNFHAVWMI